MPSPCSALSLLKSLRVLGLSLVCLAGTAQAAVYTSVWDPAYGAPFTNLGWSGSANHFVPDSCESSGTADVSNAGDCGGAAIVTSAQVVLYDITDITQTALATLNFDPASLLIGTLRYVGGVLEQFTTSASNQVNPTADLTAFGVADPVSFFLQFDLNGPRLGWTNCLRTNLNCQGGFNDAASFPPEYRITRQQVPEPSTLWLGALALATLVLRGRSAQGAGPRA